MPGKPLEYVQLRLAICRQLDADPRGLKELRDTCHQLGHIAAFKLDDQHASDVIKRLERKLVIDSRRNDFSKFVDILQMLGRNDVIRLLPGYESTECDSKFTKAVIGDSATTNNNTTHHENHMHASSSGGASGRPPSRQPDGNDSTMNDRADIDHEGRISDIELHTLSEAIRPEWEYRLGVYLDIPVPVIERYESENRISGAARTGTFKMLVAWRNDVEESRQKDVLMKALSDAGLPDIVATHLDGGRKDDNEQDKGPFSRSSIVSDKQLVKLSSQIGSGWTFFGIQHLGMKQTDIERFRDGTNHVSYSIFKMLYEWKTRQQERATVGFLLDLLSASSDIDHESYAFIIDELGGES